MAQMPQAGRDDLDRTRKPARRADERQEPAGIDVELAKILRLELQVRARIDRTGGDDPARYPADRPETERAVAVVAGRPLACLGRLLEHAGGEQTVECPARILPCGPPGKGGARAGFTQPQQECSQHGGHGRAHFGAGG